MGALMMGDVALSGPFFMLLECYGNVTSNYKQAYFYHHMDYVAFELTFLLIILIVGLSLL